MNKFGENLSNIKKIKIFEGMLNKYNIGKKFENFN